MSAATVPQPTRKAWTEAARRATIVEPTDHPRRFLVQSATLSHVKYAVDLEAQTCTCPATRHCYHMDKAQVYVDAITQAAEDKLAALKARYGGAAGLMQAFGMEDV